MMEAVFSDSAAGSLKQAQSFGEGPCRSPAMVAFTKGEETPAPEELAQAQRHAEERYRRAWEEATPLGGRATDVFSFDLGLSTGEIAQIKLPSRLEDLRRRFAAGEKLRIWYSDQPDERCGLYWLIAQLPHCEGEITCIRLPEFTYQRNTMRHWSSCGELSPWEWHRLLPLEKRLPALLRRHCAAKWKELEEENAPLRAVINGEVRSVPEDVYDFYIRREIAIADPEFHEARVIGAVLGKYDLRVSDLWIHGRIEKMVRSGELEAVTQPEDICYRRVLRKTSKFTA